MPLNCHILLIEDDEDDVTLFQYSLQKNAFPCQLTILTEGDQVAPYLRETTTRPIANGLPNLAFQSPRPNVIVLDLNLPKVHGRDLLLYIKSTDEFSQIPVVVLSTSSTLEDKTFCLNHGAARFLTKPTTIEGLDSVVRVLAELID